MKREDAIVKAAVAWFHACVQGKPAIDTPEHERLWAAIEAYVDNVEPETRPWCQIPAGWLVAHPTKSDVWIEVTYTKDIGDAQLVTLRMPTGEIGSWPRGKHEKVTCKPGPDSAPFDVFGTFPGASIIEDRKD